MGLQVGSEVTFVASTEDWPVVLAVSPGEVATAERARRRGLLTLAGPASTPGPGARLVLATDAFTVAPGYRLHEVERARYAGRSLTTVIAGYYWFTDWGRDTMISLEGLTLCTRRYGDAREILRTFGRYVRDGLVPNMFPEGSNEGLYNTADATLWYFHALARYLEYTADAAAPRRDAAHRSWTSSTTTSPAPRFGIGVDPADVLLHEGTPELPLTWMDAKYDGWVVTPRRGKAVEINALWYNALRLMERWAAGATAAPPDAATPISPSRCEDSSTGDSGSRRAATSTTSWTARRATTRAFRPNQIFALSLPIPVLRPERWAPVVEAVRERLLTPFGLRSLAPGRAGLPRHLPRRPRARDAAYHQGTVWPWLIGPFVDAWLRVHPDDRPDGLRVPRRPHRPPGGLRAGQHRGDLRRRAAVHPPRLHRAGVERRGGAPRTAEARGGRGGAGRLSGGGAGCRSGPFSGSGVQEEPSPPAPLPGPATGGEGRDARQRDTAGEPTGCTAMRGGSAKSVQWRSASRASSVPSKTSIRYFRT